MASGSRRTCAAPRRSSASPSPASSAGTRRPYLCALARGVRRAGADGVFIGGSVDVSNGPTLGEDLRSALGERFHILAPDGFTPVSSLRRGGLGPAAEGTTVSIPAAPSERLGGEGARFVAEFEDGDRQAGRVLLGRRRSGHGGSARCDRELGRQPRLGDVERLQDQGHERDARQLLVRPERRHHGRRDHDLSDRGGKANVFAVITPRASLVR